jgi:hypothetical protein
MGKPSLFELLYRTGLQHRFETTNGKTCVDVMKYFRKASEVNETEPVLTADQLLAICEFLGAERLDTEIIEATDKIDGLVVNLPAIRYTKGD